MLWFWKVYGKLENNCLKICISHFIVVTLHSQSGPRVVLNAKMVLKNFSKLFSEKFGGFKNMLYLCNRFRL